jgi:hypothetical protein
MEYAMLVFKDVTNDQVGPMIAAMKADGYTNIAQTKQDDGNWSLFGDPPAGGADTANPATGGQRLVDALIQVESGGDDFAEGDKHLADHAFGCLQIRSPVCIDVNQRFGTNIKPEDMLGNRALSIDTFAKYMQIYATAGRLGRPVTDEDRARIWNGGPNGYQNNSTLGYWDKVQEALG